MFLHNNGSTVKCTRHHNSDDIISFVTVVPNFFKLCIVS